MKKILPFAVVLSIALNAVLAYLVFRPHDDASIAAAAAPTTTVAAKEPAITDKEWSKMESADLPNMVSRLRAAGFPPDVLRAILTAQFSAEYRARQLALDPDRESRPFWKNATPDPKVQEAMQQLAREHRKLLRDLLGPDSDDDNPLSRLNNRGLTDLPPGKADQVKDLVREYSDRRSEYFNSLSAGSGPIMFTAADQKKMREFDDALHAEIAKVLTPQELELYDLQNSNTARSLRYQLTAFDATEDEFRAIYKLQRAFDEQRPNEMMSNPSQEQIKQYMDAQKQLKDQIKLAIGDARFAEYERSTDYSYRQTSQLVSRLELPPETTGQLYSIQKDYEKRMMDLRKAASSREEVLAQAKVMQEEAVAKLTPILGGQRGLDAYKQYGGAWLNRMVPRQDASGSPTGGVMIMRSGG